MLKHVNKSASIVRDEYEIAVIGTAWNNKEFRGIQQRLLKRYLEVNGLFYKEKIKILISSLKSETDNFKLTPAIVQTAIVTLFVANVTQFLNVLYNTHKEFAFLIFAVVVFLIVLISIVLLMIPYNSDDIKSIIFKKLYLKKDIIDKLEDMLLIYFE